MIRKLTILALMFAALETLAVVLLAAWGLNFGQIATSIALFGLSGFIGTLLADFALSE